MIRHFALRDFTMCKALLLAGLIGVGLLATRFEDVAGASMEGYDDARGQSQIEFIDWEFDTQPVIFAPWI